MDMEGRGEIEQVYTNYFQINILSLLQLSSDQLNKVRKQQD